MADIHSRRIRGNLAFWDTHRKRLIEAIGPDVYKYVDDFTHLDMGAADAPAGWTVTLVETGGGESTVALTDAVGGALLITTDAADNDGVNMQLDSESFELTSDQDVYFGIKLQANEATQNDFLVGLCINDTDLLGGMTDGVYFEKVDGGTGISTVTEKDSTETQSDDEGTFAATTDFTLEFYYSGADAAVEFFIDGASVGTSSTNIPDDEALKPSIHYLTGTTAAKTLTVDWLRVIAIGR